VVFLSSRFNFSSTESVVRAGLLVMGILVVTLGFGQSSWGGIARLHADEAFQSAATSLQLKEFDDIVSQCREKGVLDTVQPKAGVCSKAGPQGAPCIEVLWCRYLGAGRIVEVTMQGSWHDPKTGGVAQRRLSFRRTRW